MTWLCLASLGMFGSLMSLLAEERWIWPDSVPPRILGAVGLTWVTGAYLEK